MHPRKVCQNLFQLFFPLHIFAIIIVCATLLILYVVFFYPRVLRRKKRLIYDTNKAKESYSINSDVQQAMSGHL